MIARPTARHPRRPRSPQAKRRRGVVLLESGLIYSATLLLLLGVMVLGLGVFRYQQLAAMARDGARWASVHGPQRLIEQPGSATTSINILVNITANPNGIMLDVSALTCTLDPLAWGLGLAKVTLTYTWTPEAFAVYLPPIRMTSTAVAPILY